MHHALCVGDACARKDPELLRLLSVAMAFGSASTALSVFDRVDLSMTHGTRSRLLYDCPANQSESDAEVHSRSLVDVGATDSYSPGVHTVSSVHILSLVDVGATDSC